MKIWFLLGIWVPIELKMKIFLEKLTHVLPQSGMKHGLSGIHICRVIYEKQGFYFYTGNCKYLYWWFFFIINTKATRNPLNFTNHICSLMFKLWQKFTDTIGSAKHDILANIVMPYGTLIMETISWKHCSVRNE